MKKINVDQFMAEFPHSFEIEPGDETIIRSEAAKEEITAALDAHVADPKWQEKQHTLFLRREAERALRTERVRAAHDTLVDWSVAAQQAHDDWPKLTPLQRDALLRETLGRFAVLLARFADFIDHARVT